MDRIQKVENHARNIARKAVVTGLRSLFLNDSKDYRRRYGREISKEVWISSLEPWSSDMAEVILKYDLNEEEEMFWERTWREEIGHLLGIGEDNGSEDSY